MQLTLVGVLGIVEQLQMFCHQSNRIRRIFWKEQRKPSGHRSLSKVGGLSGVAAFSPPPALEPVIASIPERRQQIEYNNVSSRERRRQCLCRLSSEKSSEQDTQQHWMLNIHPFVSHSTHTHTHKQTDCPLEPDSRHLCYGEAL